MVNFIWHWKVSRLLAVQVGVKMLLVILQGSLHSVMVCLIFKKSLVQKSRNLPIFIIREFQIRTKGGDGGIQSISMRNNLTTELTNNFPV